MTISTDIQRNIIQPIALHSRCSSPIYPHHQHQHRTVIGNHSIFSPANPYPHEASISYNQSSSSPPTTLSMISSEAGGSICDLQAAPAGCPTALASIHCDGRLPDHLLDLIDLHSSFLTALSIHCAHHGPLMPAELGPLAQTVARSWGKRAVSLLDVRRILAVQQLERKENSLWLSDYGNGSVRVEIAVGTKPRGVLHRPINEETLNRAFYHNLTHLWQAWNTRSASLSMTKRYAKADSLTEFSTEHISNFLDSLPLSTISVCDSVRKIQPLITRGQRRLEDFRSTALVRKRKLKGEDSTKVGACSKRPKAACRSKGLLERVRAKALERASSCPAPSQDTIDRKASLERLEEIVPILTHLSSSSSPSAVSSTLASSTSARNRTSLPLSTLLQHLRLSLKNPISRAEGTRALNLLAEEIAPEWVEVVSMGQVTAVVLRKGGQPTTDLLRERVHRSILNGKQ